MPGIKIHNPESDQAGPEMFLAAAVRFYLDKNEGREDAKFSKLRQMMVEEDKQLYLTNIIDSVGKEQYHIVELVSSENNDNPVHFKLRVEVDGHGFTVTGLKQAALEELSEKSKGLAEEIRQDLSGSGYSEEGKKIYRR